jgi:hypothetical protein
MADSKHDIAAAMLCNALISHCGSRQQATEKAAKRIDKQPDATGRALWGKVHNLLKSGQAIPPHRGHFDSIPSRHAVHYIRINFADGGTVGQKVSKETANYSPFGSEENHCSICRMFREPHACTAVKGEISRTAICDFFERQK